MRKQSANAAPGSDDPSDTVPKNIRWEWERDFERLGWWLMLRMDNGLRHHVFLSDKSIYESTAVADNIIKHAVQTFIDALLRNEDARSRNKETYH